MKLFVWKGIILFACLLIACVANPITSQHGRTDEEKLLNKSHEMRSYMNETMDPCENFYEFACGNWDKIHPAKGETRTQTDYMLHIKEVYDERAISMLKDTADPVDTDIDRTVKRYYRSCIHIMEEGLDVDKLKGVIVEFGAMPVLSDEWNEKDFDWVETLAKIIRTYGYQIIMGFEISADLRDNTKNRLYLGEIQLELESKSVYLEPVGEKYRKIYKQGIAAKLENYFGVDPDLAETTAEEILNFEILLARGITGVKSDESLDKLLSATTVEKLHAKYASAFDVKKFVKMILGEIPEEMIYEYSVEFMENVIDSIQKTDRRVIANYIYYQLINPFLIETGKPEAEYETYCLAKVNEQFAKNIDNMMYRRIGDTKEVEEDVQRIWNALKALFKVRLQSSASLDWMSAETREKAIAKLESLKLEINSYRDFDFETEFKGLETSEDDFIANLKSITMLKAKRDLRVERLNEAAQPIDAAESLSFTPANILMENKVKVPLALLQPYSVWAKNFPDALKFGILGYLLGHEMVHTFDETGRQFGRDGNLEDWWDQKSVHEFEKRRTCFRDQYHGYVYGGNPLPLSENQAENIADNSGLQLAYAAYMNGRSSADDGADEKMPDMLYSGKQLFFIGFGQFWCNDIQEFLRNLQAQTDEHTPAKFRTVGVVSNSKEFSEAFECKAGTRMNPTTKCEMY